MMPDLPNVGMERDMEQFKEYFENPAFRSDGLKIYPTLVIRGTGLYELWRTGRYQNYTPNALVDLVARILALVPPWTRIYRVQRDIPMPLVTSGVEHGNLRELALNRMKDLGTECRDVRTREVGITEIHHKIQPDQVELIRRDYVANGGWETFLSYEDPHQDILVGLLRLRKCSPQTFRPELTSAGQTSIVRELHVYGSVVPMHDRDPLKFQHQGFGTLLMEEAERIAREEHGSVKLSVISGVGVRHYYAKLGYHLDGMWLKCGAPYGLLIRCLRSLHVQDASLKIVMFCTYFQNIIKSPSSDYILLVCFVVRCISFTCLPQSSFFTTMSHEENQSYESDYGFSFAPRSKQHRSNSIGPSTSSVWAAGC